MGTGNEPVVSVPSLKIACTPSSNLVGVKGTDQFKRLASRFQPGIGGTLQTLVILLNFLKTYDVISFILRKHRPRREITYLQ